MLNRDEFISKRMIEYNREEERELISISDEINFKNGTFYRAIS